MTPARMGLLLALAVIDSALLLAVGVAMWSDPPSPAEEAVGKGLVAVGAAVAIPTFVLACAWLGSLQEQDARRTES